MRCHKGRPKCTRPGDGRSCAHVAAVELFRSSYAGGLASWESWGLQLSKLCVLWCTMLWPGCLARSSFPASPSCPPLAAALQPQPASSSDSGSSGSDGDEGSEAEGGAAEGSLGEPPPIPLVELRKRGSGSPAHPCGGGEVAAMNQLLREGPPQELRPPMPLGCCRCGETYSTAGYVEVRAGSRGKMLFWGGSASRAGKHFAGLQRARCLSPRSGACS